MSQSPAAHAADAASALSRKLSAARADEIGCVERLSSIEADIALFQARFEDLATRQGDGSPTSGQMRQRLILEQRISALEALRTSMIADRARRRREIDEMEQRKQAIDAALAVLRARAAGIQEMRSL